MSTVFGFRRSATTARRLLSVFIAWSAAALPLVAQDSNPATKPSPTPPGAAEILTLHAIGYTPEEFRKLFATNGEPTLTAEEIARLEHAGVPAATVDSLKATAAKHAKKSVSFDELLTLVKAGVGEAELLAVVNGAAGPIADSEQLLLLVRAGASTTVIRAVRAKSAATPGAETRPATEAGPPPSLDDLPRLVQRGFAPETLIRRIEGSTQYYDVDAVKLVELTRQGVPTDVLKAVWARRRPTDDASGAAADMAGNVKKRLPDAGHAADERTADGERTAGAALKGVAASSETGASRPVEDTGPPKLVLHDDPPLGCALLSPAGFEVRSDANNGNTVTSFVQGAPAESDGLAEAELAVYTFRSNNPERLIEANLGPIGDIFLSRLTASYATRKIRVTFGTQEPRRLAGRAAMRVPMAAAAGDGTTHVGELWWTFVGERTFILLSASRSDLVPRYGESLSKCLRSFAAIEKKTRPAGGEDRAMRATAAASTWMDAVKNRDFALYDALHAAPSRDQARLTRFSEFCDQVDDPNLRLVLGPVDTFKEGAISEFRLLGEGKARPVVVRWKKQGDEFVIAE